MPLQPRALKSPTACAPQKTKQKQQSQPHVITAVIAFHDRSRDKYKSCYTQKRGFLSLNMPFQTFTHAAPPLPKLEGGGSQKNFF